ncbi:LytR C-terminal domain-containing protein [Brachybacterium sp. DNPG3]
MSEQHRTHPYGRSADDVRRRDQRLGRLRRVRITQLVVFSALAIALISVGVYAIRELSTPSADPGEITAKDFSGVQPVVSCPDDGAVPLAPDQVTVNVYNGTSRSGLAGSTSSDLVDRGYVAGETGNTREAGKTITIVYGPDGYLAAQSVLAQVGEAVLTLDDREDASVDLLLGDGFGGLVDSSAAAEALDTPVATPDGCG